MMVVRREISFGVLIKQVCDVMYPPHNLTHILQIQSSVKMRIVPFFGPKRELQKSHARDHVLLTICNSEQSTYINYNNLQ